MSGAMRMAPFVFLAAAPIMDRILRLDAAIY